jgi:preprotein translocase subunit YajC
VAYLIILIALFGLMWLLFIRPQRRRQAEQARVQDVLEPGDEILTAGGIHGTVQSVEGEIVHVEIAPGTTIRLDRRAVASVAHEPEPEELEEAEPEELEEAEEPEPLKEPEPEAEKVANPEHTVKGDGS